MARLSTDDARRFYDRLGEKQDSQTFYEQPAIDLLLRHGNWREARSVLEFGSGTGRVAKELLDARLDSHCEYSAIDLSPGMVAIAQARLRPWLGRARVTVHDGGSRLPFPDETFDRFLSNYVLDLLDDARINELLAEAHRTLRPGGLLCVCGLTHGTTLASRVVAAGWRAAHALRPSLVGGCRPLDLPPFCNEKQWEFLVNETVTPYAIASQAVVARRV